MFSRVDQVNKPFSHTQQSPSQISRVSQLDQSKTSPVPLKSTPLLESKISHQPTPVIGSVETTTRRLEIVDLYSIMNKWQQKVTLLEDELAKLKRGEKPVPETKQVVVQDETKLSQLQQELQSALEQIRQLRQSKNYLEKEQQDLSSTDGRLQETIDDLQNRLREKSAQHDQNLLDIESLQNQLDDMSSETEEKYTTLYSEVGVWKQKFIELNREYSTVNEELMMGQAELDNLKVKMKVK